MTSLINSKNVTLAVILGLNSVISAYYYLKIVRLMTLKQQETNEAIQGFGLLNQAIIIGLTVPVILLGVFWENIFNIANGAKIFIQ